MENKINKYSAEYTSYLKNGESAAVFLVRDLAVSIKTEKKWVHIVKMCNAENYNGQRYFNYIICELFDRKILPKYPTKKENEPLDQHKNQCKYITWQTAQEDINKQKEIGIEGTKFLLLCKLVNLSQGNVVYENAYWNTTFGRWVETGRSITPSCVLKKRKRYIRTQKPDWKYEVNFVNKLIDSEFEYIHSQLNNIDDAIEEHKKATPDMFFKKNNRR